MLLITVVFAFLWQKCEQRCLVTGKVVYENKKGYFQLAVCIIGTFLPMYLVNSSISYVGNDYVNYYRYYQNIAAGRNQDVEIAYKLINRLVIKMGLDFQWIYFITCFLAYGLLIWCIYKYSSNYALSYVLFFTGGYFFLLGLNQIRQFVAVGCVMLAFQFIEKKKPLIYFALVILGSMFHVTAIVMLPFYFILGKKIRLSMYAVVSMAILPINFFFNDIMVWLFKTFMPRYLQSDYVSRTYKMEIPYLTMILLTVFIIFFLVSCQQGEMSVTNRVFFNGCLMGAVIGTFCSWLPEYTRFVYYFFVPTIFYMPKLLVQVKKQWIKVACVVSVVLADLIYVSTIIGYSNVLPYKSFF